MHSRRLFLFYLVILLCCGMGLSAQNEDTIKLPQILDNTREGFMARVQAFAAKESKQSILDLEADKAVIAQYRILEQMKGSMQKAKLYLQKNIDTTGIKAELDQIHHDMAIAGDGVFTNRGTAYTFRNLSATSKILAELLNKVNARKIRLEIYNDALNDFRYRLDSLSAEPMLFKFSDDSLTALQYVKQLVLVAREIGPVHKSLKQANNHVQVLLNNLNITALNLQSSLDEIAVYQQAMANTIFKREFSNIWDDKGVAKSFKYIIDYSVKKTSLTIVFYVLGNKAKIFIILALILIAFTYLRSLKNIYIEKGLLQAGFQGQLVLRYPLLAATVIVINLFQFIFISPPFLWSMLLWISSAICLSVVFRSYITRYWMVVWLVMLFLFLLASTDNLILQASLTERWLMLLVALAGSIIGCYVYFTGDKKILREQWIVYAIGLMTVLELLSIIANIFGRYNLAKSFLISGFQSVVIAIMFLWTVRLINEGLSLAFSVYQQPNAKLFYLNPQKLGRRAPAIFYILLVAGWAILFGRNFPVFEYFVPVISFFASERSLGDFTFSINGILLFTAIITCSVMISKIVSFFASDQHFHSNDKRQKGLGSWLLLIRIAILTIGLFLAVAAAGIPMDRITIVLGALGVGIGFGLQTLVNNLVSGLIIAFEKPVNMGDFVDVDGQSGTMKSIGFRSSIISTWDGADVVIPNGDLLNSHLINWSSAGNKKRASILIGIAYDANLNKAKTLLEEILEAEDRLAQNPKYVIQYEQFNNSAIDLRIYFWTKHISESLSVKSDLIVVINDRFSKNGIQIPYPQQDIHLYGEKNKDA